MNRNRDIKGTDSVLAACLAASGIPRFMLLAVEAEGRIPEVYRRLGERLGDRPLTIRDVEVVKNVLEEILTNDTPAGSDASADSTGGSRRDPSFPRPRLLGNLGERFSFGGPSEPESSAALVHLRDRIALQRMSDLVTRWRSGLATAEETLGLVEETLSNLAIPSSEVAD